MAVLNGNARRAAPTMKKAMILGFLFVLLFICRISLGAKGYTER